MGDDWIWRWGKAFLSTGDRGEEARRGDEESGEGTFGRWSKEDMGVATESMVFLVADGCELFFRLGMCVFYVSGRGIGMGLRLRGMNDCLSRSVVGEGDDGLELDMKSIKRRDFGVARHHVAGHKYRWRLAWLGQGGD